MAVGTSAMCGTFKTEAMAGIHFWTPHTRTGSSAITADTFKIAMFTDSSSIDADTTGYTTSNEVSGVPTAYLDFADSTWSAATISSARGALIYNSTLSTAGTGSTTNHAAYPAVAVINFGGDKASSAGDFTIQFPANDANNAIIRIA